LNVCRSRWKEFPTVCALFLAALFLAALFSGCSQEEKPKPPVVEVQIAPVQKADIQETVSAEAVLFPLHQSAITPKIVAPVKQFYVNRGAHVKAGQLLAVLENRDLEAAAIDNRGTYQQAEAQYKTTTAAALPEEMKKAQLDADAAKQELDAAQKVFDSRQNLYQQGALPRKDLDAAGVALVQARNQYNLAQQHLDALKSVSHEEALKAAAGQLASAKGKYLGAEAQLSYTEVRSPINGVVTDRPNYPGETPTAGTPLLTVMDTSQIIAKAHIPQEQAALLKAGDAATLNSPESGQVNAKVTLVSPALDPNSTTVEVWVQAANSDGKLRPGGSATVSMIAQTVRDAFIVPTSAILTGSDGATTVMLAGNDGKAHEQPVEVGIRQGDKAQITKGVKAGDTVIVGGAYGLPDNTQIKIAQAPPTAEEDKPSGDKSGKPDEKE
jgi:multidrug efflux pump subunit AcrA (membrane-fusion protein)